jgi:anthranilate phosphoribosyltransferase
MVESAKIFLEVLENRATPEQHSVVVANSALAICCIDESKTLEDGLSMAEETLISGKAFLLLKKLISLQ